MFVKGQSGNPAGRQRKPRAKGEAQLRADLLTKAPGLIEILEERAQAGDVAAARLLLDRCLPALRPADQPVAIALDDLPDAARSILAALANGTLTPDQAQKLSNTVAALARTIESLEFESRLSTLEIAANAKP